MNSFDLFPRYNPCSDSIYCFCSFALSYYCVRCRWISLFFWPSVSSRISMAVMELASVLSRSIDNTSAPSLSQASIDSFNLQLAYR